MGGLCSSVVVEDDHSQIIDTASIETKKATTNIKNAIQTTTKGQETPMKAEQKEDTRSNEQPPLSEEEVEVLQLIKYSTICILRNLATALGHEHERFQTLARTIGKGSFMDLMRGEVFKKLFLDLYVVGSPGKPELLPTDPLFTQHTFLNFLNAAEKNAPLKRRITPTEVLPLYKAAALKVRKRLRKGYEHSDISALKTELYFFDNAFSFLCSDELEQDPTSIFQAMESMFETNPP